MEFLTCKLDYFFFAGISSIFSNFPDSLRNPFIYPKHDRICAQPQASPNGVYGKLGLDPFADLSLPDDTRKYMMYNTSSSHFLTPR